MGMPVFMEDCKRRCSRPVSYLAWTEPGDMRRCPRLGHFQSRSGSMDANAVLGIVYTAAVIGVCAMWFHRCARADKGRQGRAFSKRTFRYAGPGFLLGIVFLTSDLGSPPVGL